MACYRFTYQSKTRFSIPVTGHSFLIRTIPFKDDTQQLVESSLCFDPKPDSCSYDIDKWGAEISYGILCCAHTHFSYISSGIVNVTGKPRPDSTPSPVFKATTPLTAFSPDMALLCVKDNTLAAATAMCANVFEHMTYVSASTSIKTTASEAFGQRKGVCQDFSHILIAICRRCGIHARYVCGFVTGEGETHAWVEIWHEGFWYGFDATSGLPCDDRYIAIAFGRDAADCSVNRGVFTGIAMQDTVTKVTVERIEDKW